MQSIKSTSENTLSASTPADAALRTFVGYRLKRAYNIIRSDLLERLEPLGLRITTYSALVLVVENPGMRQSELATVLAIKRSNMVAIIDDLEGAGWIERRAVPEDRRAFALFVTDAGKTICRKANSLARENESALLHNLTAAEKRSLTGLLEKIELSAGID